MPPRVHNWMTCHFGPRFTCFGIPVLPTTIDSAFRESAFQARIRHSGLRPYRNHNPNPLPVHRSGPQVRSLHFIFTPDCRNLHLLMRVCSELRAWETAGKCVLTHQHFSLRTDRWSFTHLSMMLSPLPRKHSLEASESRIHTPQPACDNCDVHEHCLVPTLWLSVDYQLSSIWSVESVIGYEAQ